MRTIRLVVALTVANLAILLAGLAHARAAPEVAPPVLRGSALELVDGQGRMRARLNVEAGGEVVFRLMDETGTIRVKLGAGTGGSGLLLANDATEPGIHMIAGADGSRVRIANKDGRERLIVPE
jgi:hypothetical protein